MNTKQIDYCIELSRTLNFSRAAENLFVSQPTFSYQIRLLEEEIGFPIFYRNGKGAELTPAGSQFVSYLGNMREELKRAVEQGQNFSAKYKDNISISMMVRQAIYFLPEAMRLFAESDPEVQITPMFQYEGGMDSFLRGDADILFALSNETRHLSGVTVVGEGMENKNRRGLTLARATAFVGTPTADVSLAGNGISVSSGTLRIGAPGVIISIW